VGDFVKCVVRCVVKSVTMIKIAQQVTGSLCAGDFYLLFYPDNWYYISMNHIRGCVGGIIIEDVCMLHMCPFPMSNMGGTKLGMIFEDASVRCGSSNPEHVRGRGACSRATA
jgi:hypothetical protein